MERQMERQTYFAFNLQKIQASHTLSFSCMKDNNMMKKKTVVYKIRYKKLYRNQTK